MKILMSAMWLLIVQVSIFAQSVNTTITLRILSDKGTPLSNATVELLHGTDSTLLKLSISDTSGHVSFTDLTPGSYLFRAGHIGYQTFVTPIYELKHIAHQLPDLTLHPITKTLEAVIVKAPRTLIETQNGKTIVNIANSTTQIGATVYEMLEKLPGVSLDRNGQITLKGRSGVLIMIDGKPSYLDPSALNNLLASMSTAQVSQVEIMDQPSAKYDAAGNAGVINIKTKKVRQHGVTTNVNTSFSHGRYPKTNQSLQFNYRSGKVNVFTNYTLNASKAFTRLYALRNYLKQDGTSSSVLEQFSFIKGRGVSHALQTGADYSLTPKTTLSLVFTGTYFNRNNNGNNTAEWKQPSGLFDSLILTRSSSKNNQQNKGVTLSLQQQFSGSAELTADFDAIRYKIEGYQQFNNTRIHPTPEMEASQGRIPSQIDIVAARANYSRHFKKVRFESGWKSSYITTDNLAAYQNLTNGSWEDDYNRTSHFKYNERIHALYSFVNWRQDKWTAQGGLRYEWTNYNGHQLGNALRKDSSFSRDYHSFFPSATITLQADSLHAFSLSAGQRIDRPAYQKLNPFLFIINKYTYQRGNPYLRPQYTWNLTLTHSFKQALSTSVTYSHTRDYYSQVFLSDPSGVMIYTEGNVGQLHNLGASISLQLSPMPWWALSTQASINHKKLTGELWKTMEATITQGSLSVQNQFRFSKGWGAELTGFYNSRSQQDIQEVVDPSGQVALGISKALWKNKATLKGSFRDIFYTQAMQGLTTFENATEFFRLTRDTRMVTLALSYRFGKPTKTNRRRNSSAAEEMQRVGS